ncbi:MAG: PH domain-containing protein [Staphylococcus sp.]|nr:PH domain-containing protein [Staphylococcus sp.]
MPVIKERVNYSPSVAVVSIMLLAFFSIICFRHWDENIGWIRWAVIAAFIIIVVASLCYSPCYVSVGDGWLKISRICSPARKISVDEIARVLPHSRTMTDVRRRLLGGGGFIGYWGWFTSPAIGRYFAYVGNWNESFLVELKSGRKYVISCNNHDKIVEAINRQIGA